jgi:hypothetical protein
MPFSFSKTARFYRLCCFSCITHNEELSRAQHGLNRAAPRGHGVGWSDLLDALAASSNLKPKNISYNATPIVCSMPENKI